MRSIRAMVASIPFLGRGLRQAYRFFFRKAGARFTGSADYWEQRYRSGGTSGSGSYGRLAEFKAKFLNDFVERNQITSVVELGCGDGAQLELAKYPKYVGVDVAQASIDLCRSKFSEKTNYKFYMMESRHFRELQAAELALSLDVIFHLVEDEIFENYMRRLFASATRFVIIYAYDFDRLYAPPHERGRNFTSWIERNEPEWALTDVVQNPYPYDRNDPENTSQSDFFVFEYKAKA